MRKTISGTLSALLLGLSTSVTAAEFESINWSDLVPEQQNYENPFAEMSTDHIRALADLLRLKMEAENRADGSLDEEIKDMYADLEADGLNPDRLFEQREKVMQARMRNASEPNTAVVGQAVRLPGYLLPLEITESRATEFLLVPTVGACIHTPPPPANQIVHVTYEPGFEIETLYTPIWISGEMILDNEVMSIYLVDGNVDVSVTYKMNAALVEGYN